MSLTTYEEWVENAKATCLICPLCCSAQQWRDAYYGVLGTRAHFRCRCCGGQWSMEEGEDVNV